MSEEPTSETANVGGIVATYEHSARLQQQKLLMASYVLERKAEIDNPITAARSILRARYAHIAPDKIDEVLRMVADVLASDGPDNNSLRQRPLPSEVSDALDACDKLLPDGYGLACASTFFQQFLSSVNRAGGNVDDLRASLFTGLIADFESFMVSFLTDLYRRDPRKLSSRERSISWAEIFSLRDLDAYRDELLDQAVVDIMRGSFGDWMDTLKRDHEVAVEVYTSSPLVGEMFQRRHVLIHNGGKVSRLYMEKCPKMDVQPGQELKVSQEYFEESVDRLAVVALSLVVNALLKAKAEEPYAIERRMANWVYELLLRRRYSAVRDYLSQVPFDRMVNQEAKEICRVNLWLSLKRLGRFNECAAEVEAWQVGHLGDRYRLAKLALLGALGAAVELCQSMRAGGHLLLGHWIEWPLLEEVREYEAEHPGKPEDSCDAEQPDLLDFEVTEGGPR